MRYTYVTLLFGAIVTMSSPTMAKPLSCADKQHDIEQQITYAKLHRQDARIAALETALAQNKANCTDKRLLQERQQSLKEKEAKVNKATQKLNDATASGKTNKINERTTALEQAKKERDAARALVPAN